MRTPLILHKETLRVLSAEQASTVGGAHRRNRLPTASWCIFLDSWDCPPTQEGCLHPTAMSKGCTSTRPDLSLETTCPI